MLVVAIGLVLAVTQPSDLAEEGQWLGRASTLFGICGSWYDLDIEKGRSAANDFAQRAEAAGWTDDQIGDAYDAGRAAERAGLGMQTLPSGEVRLEPERGAYFFQQSRIRCEVLATRMPGSISNLSEGNRKLDRLIRRGR